MLDPQFGSEIGLTYSSVIVDPLWFWILKSRASWADALRGLSNSVAPRTSAASGVARRCTRRSAEQGRPRSRIRDFLLLVRLTATRMDRLAADRGVAGKYVTTVWLLAIKRATRCL